MKNTESMGLFALLFLIGLSLLVLIFGIITQPDTCAHACTANHQVMVNCSAFTCLCGEKKE